MTDRCSVLQLAKEAFEERAKVYGAPEDNAVRIAGMWSAFLGVHIRPEWVAIMLGHVKDARLRASSHHEDSWVDKAGYAAYGAEVAARRCGICLGTGIAFPHNPYRMRDDPCPECCGNGIQPCCDGSQEQLPAADPRNLPPYADK